MIEESVVLSLRKRYHAVHPLIFQRSVERATGPGDLYEILENIPNELPLSWDEKIRRWVVTSDMTQSKEFEILEK